MHNGVSVHLVKDVLVSSEFWQLGLKLLQSSACSCLCGHQFSTHSRQHPGPWWLDRMVGACLVLCKTTSLRPSAFALPPAMNDRVPVAPRPLQHLVLSGLWTGGILIGVCLLLFGLITFYWHTMQRGFSCAYLSSACLHWKVSVEIFCPFINWVLFLLLSFTSSSSILDNRPL